ncbi:unnamed protein product [Dicrocoelium dendriticum]|nr:unnamed protein product [Dicrocoelium dendriticum]
MSINFNKLFIQDILTHRGSSHHLDINESNTHTEGEEAEFGSDEAELSGSDSYDGLEEFDQTIRRMGKEHLPASTQKRRLVEVFQDLRSAIEQQARLHFELNKQIGLQDSAWTSDTIHEGSREELGNKDNSAFPNTRGQLIKSRGRRRPHSAFVHEDSRESQTDEQSLRKFHGHRRRINSQLYSVDNAPTAAVDGELLSFKRCERLSKKKEQVVVEIRVVFLKVGEIDTLKEIYHADAFIQAKWKEPRLEGKTDEELRRIDLQRCWNPLIIIDNILSESKDQHWMTTQKTEKREIYIVERRRLRGIFLETLELNDFPLDVQDLTITLTSERPDSEVVLVPDRTELCGINLQTLVDQQEWKLHEHIEVTRRSATQEYTNSSQCHPCISVTCRAARRPGYFYWNVFLIMFFITGLSFATFAVPPERPENRLQLSFTLFLTSVAFKFVINQSLPKISYLTYMDKYVLMSLAILCVVSVWHAVVTLIPTDAELEQATATNMLRAPTQNNTGYSGKGSILAEDLTVLTQNRIRERSDVNITDTLLQHTGGNDKLNVTSRKQTDSFTKLADPHSIFSTKPSIFWKTQHWQEFAKRTTVEEHQKRRLRLRIEQDVFTSFCVLYALAHLTFIFWLYFDASKRRREMVERDRHYKRCLQRSTDL